MLNLILNIYTLYTLICVCAHVGISGTIYYGLLLHSVLWIYTVFLECALWAVFCVCRIDLINSAFSAIFHDNATTIRVKKTLRKT